MKITKKIFLLTMLLVTFTVLSTFTVNIYIAWDRILTDKYQEAHAISLLLEEQLDEVTLNISKQRDLTNQQKIDAINVQLQPIVDNITTSFPNFGAGYYIKDLNSIVAFGPNFNPTGLKNIRTDSEARTVYTTKDDFKFHNYSQTREGYVVANIHPIIRNDQVLGHTWGNVLMDDVFTTFKKDLYILVVLLTGLLLIAYIGSRLITKQYILHLSLFKNSILEDEPLPKKVRFTKELREVYDAYRKNQHLQLEQQRSIRELAFVDQLTKLPNRTSLYSNLQKYIHEQQQFALLFIDLDEFKTVNDTQGHLIGDRLLMLIAKRLKATLKPEDEVYRFGGDEFIILIRSYNTRDTLMAQIEQMMKSVNSTLHLEDVTYHPTISVGISLYQEHSTEVNELIRYADLAMYKAKTSGKNQYAFFEQKFDDVAGEQFDITKSLSEALDNHEFELYYQPQVSLHTGAITGFEALTFWNQPLKGVISPGKFIPITENNGFIIPLGQHILHKACTMRKELLQQGIDDLRVAVNISVKQFQHESFLRMVEDTLKRSGLDGRYLELEITEGVAMDEPEIVIEKLKALQALDISISIDDFGMGYSSLNYLKRLPIQQLKIDRSFVQDITAENDYAIIKSIVSMADSLSLEVVAEGAETKEQVDLLKQVGCSIVQGYYFYKPIPKEELLQLLQQPITN